MVSRKTWIVVLGVATAGGYLLYRKLMEYLKEQPPLEEQPLPVPGRPEITIKPIPPGTAPSVPTQPPQVPQPSPPEEGQPQPTPPTEEQPVPTQPPEEQPAPKEYVSVVQLRKPLSGIPPSVFVPNKVKLTVWVFANRRVSKPLSGEYVVHVERDGKRVRDVRGTFTIPVGKQSYSEELTFDIDAPGEWAFWAEVDGVKSRTVFIKAVVPLYAKYIVFDGERCDLRVTIPQLPAAQQITTQTLKCGYVNIPPRDSHELIIVLNKPIDSDYYVAVTTGEYGKVSKVVGYGKAGDTEIRVTIPDDLLRYGSPLCNGNPGWLVQVRRKKDNVAVVQVYMCGKRVS